MSIVTKNKEGRLTCNGNTPPNTLKKSIIEYINKLNDSCSSEDIYFHYKDRITKVHKFCIWFIQVKCGDYVFSWPAYTSKENKSHSGEELLIQHIYNILYAFDSVCTTSDKVLFKLFNIMAIILHDIDKAFIRGFCGEAEHPGDIFSKKHSDCNLNELIVENYIGEIKIKDGLYLSDLIRHHKYNNNQINDVIASIERGQTPKQAPTGVLEFEGDLPERIHFTYTGYRTEFELGQIWSKQYYSILTQYNKISGENVNLKDKVTLLSNKINKINKDNEVAKLTEYYTSKLSGVEHIVDEYKREIDKAKSLGKVYKNMVILMSVFIITIALFIMTYMW